MKHLLKTGTKYIEKLIQVFDTAVMILLWSNPVSRRNIMSKLIVNKLQYITTLAGGGLTSQHDLFMANEMQLTTYMDMLGSELENIF